MNFLFLHTKSILVAWYTLGCAAVVTWTILTISLPTFLGWQSSITLQPMKEWDGSQMSSKISLCSEDELKSYWVGTTW